MDTGHASAQARNIEREVVMEYQNNRNENNDRNSRKADNRKYPHNRNNGQEKRTSVTRVGGRKRGTTNGHAARGKEPQKGSDRHSAGNIGREGTEHRQGKFPRKGGRSHYDHLNRPIRAKREETVDDIRADIEQVEKDIQFEIRQIKSIKLGL